MPDYQAPGVFVEENGVPRKSIEGVSTSTTALVGLTRRGPASSSETPELLTSFADFQRIYGGLKELATGVNYLAHSVLAYFNEGGARLYVARVAGGVPAASATDIVAGKTSKFIARFSGDVGNGLVRVVLNRIPIKPEATKNALEGSVLRITPRGAAPTISYAVKRNGAWTDAAMPTQAKDVPTVSDPMQLLTVTVTTTDHDGAVETYADLGLDPAHQRYVGLVLRREGNGRQDHLSRLYYFAVDSTVTAIELATAFTPTDENTAAETPNVFAVAGGTDTAPGIQAWTDALDGLSASDDVSIVGAPGHTEYAGVADGIRQALVQHVEQARSYRIAVVEVPRGKTPTEARDYKGHFDSKQVALYYPWVVTSNPVV